MPAACICVQLSHGLAFPLPDDPVFFPEFLSFPPFFNAWRVKVWHAFDSINLNTACATIL